MTARGGWGSSSPHLPPSPVPLSFLDLRAGSFPPGLDAGLSGGGIRMKESGCRPMRRWRPAWGVLDRGPSPLLVGGVSCLERDGPLGGGSAEGVAEDGG